MGEAGEGDRRGGKREGGISRENRQRGRSRSEISCMKESCTMRKEEEEEGHAGRVVKSEEK